MKTNMTIIGAGHKIAAVAFPVLIAALVAGYFYPESVRFGPAPFSLLVGTGIGLIVIGLSINFTSAVMMMRAFKNNKLLTTGPYAVSRNPMYASFIVFTLPGVALVLNNWILLAAGIVLYAAVARFVKDEERWLAQHFGALWLEYTSRVGRVFPRLW